MSHILKGAAVSLLEEIRSLDIKDVLHLVQEQFPNAITFSTSFSNEDQVITDLIDKSKVPVNIFTLDTGRLFESTYDTWESTNAHYGIHIKGYSPDTTLLQNFLDQHGPNSFYQSVERRKECCAIRKIAPLKKALQGYAVWVTGIRAEHSISRQGSAIIEWDEENKIIKYNPLLHWTTEEVSQYIRQNHLPYNILHDQGYVSIGCAPCTRAIREDEDFRAGRWWWEDDSKKECGLHIKQ